MSGIAAPADVERFRVLIARRLGLRVAATKAGFLADLLKRRCSDGVEPAQTYLERLDCAPPRAEIAALARELTVGETYFFRHREQFRALQDAALPDRLQANGATKALSLLSAGCASGEEAYSLAITLRDTIAEPGWDVAVRAVDLNPLALAKAAAGRYSPWALRETPPQLRARWFRAAGSELILDKSVRDAVRFEERNLAAEDGELWRPASYDIVFCRNVVMYFTPDQARLLIARIARALRPDGYLFLGHAETLHGLSEEFRLRHTHGTFYYQREAVPAAVARTRNPPFAPPEEAESWTDAIRRSSERIAALDALRSVAAEASRGNHDPAAALELLRRERFGEALAAIRALPASARGDPEIVLLEAMLLAQEGMFADAEAACRRLLAIDALDAGAHYLLALCRDGAGDRAAAAAYDRAAARLDPGFAMPRLHLGLLARRAGGRATARRELAEAAVLLEHETPDRVLLFGGGFSRDALRALCVSALRDCGGAP